MQKNQEILKKRQLYIKERIDKAKIHSKEVKKLSEELFLSEDTIYKDWQKVK